VFSIATSVVGGNTIWPRGLIAARHSAAVNRPPCPTTVNCTPELAAAAPDSCQTMCASWPTITSSPGRVSTLRPIWFAIVPLGTKSAAGLPSSAAIRSSRRLTLGSSPYWSSPTGASAIALRIAGDGKVTVSERRSMRSIGAPPLFDALRGVGGDPPVGRRHDAAGDHQLDPLLDRHREGDHVAARHVEQEARGRIGRRRDVDADAVGGRHVLHLAFRPRGHEGDGPELAARI